MKTALIAAAFATGAVLSAGEISSNAFESVEPSPELAFPLDLRLRDACGNVRRDLPATPITSRGPLSANSPQFPLPKPLTPLGDGEVLANHARGPDILRLRQMPMTKGQFTDPKMPMVFPDPKVDYKLLVREVPADGTVK